MNKKILFVDDEANILFVYRRQFRHLEASTAMNGAEGLAFLDNEGPFAVVVSDLRMPGMDGVRFLASVRERAPDTIRIMITGNADLEASIAAVNEGNIFRFLTKPVAVELLDKTVNSALEQYRLITAERELLEQTLEGSIKVMSETLSLVNPMAFSSALRLKRHAEFVCGALGVANKWQIEIAALLSHIGCVALPTETLEKVYAAQKLTDAENEAFVSHPALGSKLLINIPRLEPVARIIEYQNRPNDAVNIEDPDLRSAVIAGAKILRATIEFDRLVSHGDSRNAACAKMRAQPAEFDEAVVQALEKLELQHAEMSIRMIAVHNLTTDMMLDQDVYSKRGVLLVAKGADITLSVLERLKKYLSIDDIVDPVRVLVPRRLAAEFVDPQPAGT